MVKKSKTIALISLISMSLFGCMRGTNANPNAGGNGGDQGTSEKQDISYDDKKTSDDVSSSSAMESSKEEISSSKEEEPVAPIYQGMIITNAIQKQATTSATKDISDFVSTFPDIASENQVDYCIRLNETVKVLVKFHNLDKTKINSITINDKKYDVTSEMTTLEGVSLEVDAYTKSGYDTLTLTNISYTDSTNKIGAYTEEHKLSVGVGYASQVSATISSKTIKSDKATINLAFADIESIPSNGKVYAYLSSGSGDPLTEELTIDSNKTATINFTDLEFGKDYYFGVAASFDLYDGNGLHYAWILKENFKTLGTFSLDSISVGKTSISFAVKDDTKDDTAYANSVTLMDGETEKKKLTKDQIGETNSFTDLLSDHDYVIVLEYVYDGKSYKVSYDAKTDAKVAPTIAIKTTDVQKRSFKYEVKVTDIDTVGVIDSISLVNGTETKELKGEDGTYIMEGECKDLLANGNYSIKVDYHYDLNDGKGEIKDSASVKATLLETLAPELVLSTNQDEMTVSFKYEFNNNEDEIVTVDSVELLDGTSVKETMTDIANGEGSFTGLYSDKEYSVRVTYHYDLGDGQGEQKKVETKTAKTEAMAVPEVVVHADEAGKDFISGYVEINQEYNIVSNVKVTCTKKDDNGNWETTPVATVDGTSFVFGGLTSSTIYKIECTYDYTLNTENETELNHGSESLDRKTALDVSISDLKFDNTRPIEAGQKAYMSMTIHNGNDYRIQVTSITVNGTTLTGDNGDFLVTGKTDGEIRFKLKTATDDELDSYGDQDADGNTKFTIEKVTVVDMTDNEEYDVYLKDGNTVPRKIFGRVGIKDSYFADADGNKLDYFTKEDENVYVVVELNNRHKYDIKKINGRADIEEVGNDKSTYKYKYDPSTDSYGFKVLNINSIYYESEYIDSEGVNATFKKEYTVDNMFAKGYVVSDKTVNHINTWTAFYNMEDDKVYKLDTDLDFKTVDKSKRDLEETGKSFNGILDGDGHSIKNLKFASTVENKDVELGLFKEGEMFLSNLKLENVYFGLDIDNYDTTTTRSGYVGGFIAKTDKAVIDNCMVDIYSSIDFENNTIEAGGYNFSYAGGFVGYLGQYGEITNSINEAYVSTLNGYVGGFVGYMAGKMDHCYNVGTARYVKNSGSGCVGAFVGYFNRWSPVSKITNSVNLGPDRFYSTTTRIIGTCGNAIDNTKKGQTENVYNLSKLYDSTADKKNNISKLNRTEINADYFEKTLGFDADIWDMSKVDYKNKIYPTLKVFDK